ncbi:hypothetical protein D9M69_587280 [compost metagenome]
MQAQAPAATDVVEGGEGAGGDRGRGQGRTVGDHQAQAFGVGGHVGGQLQAVGAARPAGDQYAVETGMLMGAGVLAEKFQVEVSRARAMGLGPLPWENHTDELDGHRSLLEMGKGQGDIASGPHQAPLALLQAPAGPLTARSSGRLLWLRASSARSARKCGRMCSPRR